MKNNIGRLLGLAFAGLFYCLPAIAQNAGTVTNHAFPIGKGPGVTGYSSLLLGNGAIPIGQTNADPLAIVPTGDVTISAAGVTAIGTAKVVTAMMALNSVTNARLAQMANGTFKCRNTAGTGDPEDCTAAQVRTILALTIGTNVQAWDTDLDCLAALAGTGIIRRTGTGTCSNGTAVANSELATMAAYTFKGNATGSTAAPTDVSIGALTAKASPAGTDEVMIADNAASGAWKRSPVSAFGGGGSGVTTLNGQTGGLVSYYPPQGRLTLTSATPVMSTSVSGATTVYYTPYAGNMVPIYDGTNMVPTAFAEVSQTTTDTTKSPAAVAASKIYDIFCWVDSAVNRCTRGPAWTNSSTRGYTLTVVNGIPLNTSAITNGPAASRGTWVGTCASNASSTIDYIFGFATSGGGASVLNCWNTYNRVATPTNVVDTGASYTYTAATTRQARGSAGNQITFVVGDQSNAVQVSYGTENNPIGSAASTQIGVGFDTTTAFSGAGRSFIKNTGTIDLVQFTSTSYPWQPVAGLHVLSANERSDGTNASFFNNSSLATLSATIWN